MKNFITNLITSSFVILGMFMAGASSVYAADFDNYNVLSQRVFGIEEKESPIWESPIRISFSSIESITTTDIKPYLIYIDRFIDDNDFDVYHLKTYYDRIEFDFKSITCEDNTLVLEGFDFQSKTNFDLGNFYLIIPEGAIVADDGTVNTKEYCMAFYLMDIEPYCCVKDNKFIEDIFITYNRSWTRDEKSILQLKNLTEYQDDIWVRTPSCSWMHYLSQKGCDDIMDFETPGIYNVEAYVSFCINDVITNESIYCRAYLYDNVELDGLSSDFDVEYITNDMDQLTGLIMKFSDAPSVDRFYQIYDNPYVVDEQNNSFEISNHYANGNMYCIYFDEPLTEAGNYTLVLPEKFIAHVYDGKQLPLSSQLNHSFAIEPIMTTAISDISIAEKTESYDVYNAQGIKVASHIEPKSAPTSLTKGIYLFVNEHGAKKVIVQ